EFMERMTESTKATIDYFGKRVTFINVMRNMSVSCDCEGVAAEPVVTPNVGILGSLDILAIDQASVDLIYAMKEDEHHALVERMETRHGLRQLSYMKELNMGNSKYILIDLDNDEIRICHLKP
ncbi:MAG: (Fe-S)-binding protein, partial [Synergistaceae bacterium]|nr:(Fe-S)-binding protein [Synergistaceae bacterium]